MDIIKPIDGHEPITGSDTSLKRRASRGRPADLLACIIALIAGSLSLLTTVLFFLGFADNANALSELGFALAFSVGLGLYAMLPAFIIARIAYQGWRLGLKTKGIIWTMILSVPWLALSLILMFYTPLPKYMSILAFIFALLLLSWALISAFLASRFSDFMTGHR